MKVLLIFSGIFGAVVCSDVGSAFKEAKLVPDVLKSAPTEELAVSYGKNEVMMGNNLTQVKTSGRPKVVYDFLKGEYYTLVMIDPDPLSERCIFGGELLMWLVVNIPDKVRNGEEIVSYLYPFALPGTGAHRYTLLLYKQPKRISFDERSDSPFDLKNRLFFSVESFAKKYNLDNPIAGNFFTAGFHFPFLHGEF